MAEQAMADGREAGFTLLELLVALVVLGFLMVGLTEGTRFGLKAWSRQAETIAAHDQLDAVDRTLRQLLSQASLHQGDRPDSLYFTGRLPAAVGLATRRAGMELTVDTQHRLILRWTPQAHEMSLKPPAEPAATPIIAGVERLEIAYWQEADRTTGESAGWSDQYGGIKQPKLLKLTLVFPPGDRRKWPPMVIAPSAIGPGG